MSEMITYKIPPSVCPVCGTQMEGATSLEDEDRSGPTPGALGICWYCATILKYGENLELMKVSDSDRKQYLRESPALRVALQVCQERIRIRGRLNAAAN